MQMPSIRSFAIAAALTLALIGAPHARAGEYVVNGTCSAWQPFNHQESRLLVYAQCPHLRARNRSGSFRTDANYGGAGWHFDAPAGTSIRAADVDAYITGRKDWYSEVRVEGSPGQPYGLLASCYGQSPCGRNALANAFPDLNGRVVARMWCNDNSGGCPNDGAEARASIDIASSRITLHDPSPPAVAIAGGSAATSAWQGGQRELSVGGLDNSGIRAVRALVDGDARHSTTTSLPCDYSRPVPCTNRTGTVAVDLRGLSDGRHSLEGQAEDAAGNAGTSGAATINVDNTSPLPPIKPSLTGGFDWRRSNSFTVAWTNPVQSFAPISAIAYRICPQAELDTSAACRDGSVQSPNIQQLALQVPGPGLWRLRMWLVDAAGNGTAVNGATLDGLGLLAARSGEAKSHLRVGHRRRHHLERRVTLKLGQRTKLRGRLSVGRKHHGISRGLLVYRRVSVQGARYQLVSRVATKPNGHFVYRTGAGPSRHIRFVYPGDGGLAGRLATVNLRVHAKLRLHADRTHLKNGQVVTLSGRLRGGKVPPGGALLELQVFTRGRWRPFATPRTTATGRWSYGYRFETVTGTARFRFRARLRKQPTYPYIARSRAIGVRVRGR